jgi:hypothetical protein
MNAVAQFRYPRAAILGGSARATIGLAVTAFPLFMGRPNVAVAWLLAGAAVLFGIYGVRTVLRGIARIRVDDRGVAALGPLGVSVPWREMRGVTLSYYSTNRERANGWMQLNVRGHRRTLRIESTLEGFTGVVGRVVAEAERREIELSPTTRDNLLPLGIIGDRQRSLDGTDDRPPHD